MTVTTRTAQTNAAPLEAGRWGSDPIRFVWLAAAVGLLAADLGTWLTAFRSGFTVSLGVDRAINVEAGARWLHGQGFYYPFQLAGPYDVWASPPPIIYPPTAAPLFALFSLLPDVLWWAMPLGIIAGCLAWHRPRPLALLAIAGLVLWPSTLINAIYAGNPSIWVAAALVLATTGRSWAAPLVLIKPTLGPFALWGIRSRSWWIGLAFVAGVSLLFLPMWRDYLTVIGNAQDGRFTYQLWHVPLMLVPVVAWLGRR